MRGEITRRNGLEHQDEYPRQRHDAHGKIVDASATFSSRAEQVAAMESRLNELKRYGWPFGAILMDIDHFKAVNDTHGHEVGDEVLGMVARSLANTLRSFDVVGRWGGGSSWQF